MDMKQFLIEAYEDFKTCDTWDEFAEKHGISHNLAMLIAKEGRIYSDIQNIGFEKMSTPAQMYYNTVMLPTHRKSHLVERFAKENNIPLVDIQLNKPTAQ